VQRLPAARRFIESLIATSFPPGPDLDLHEDPTPVSSSGQCRSSGNCLYVCLRVRIRNICAPGSQRQRRDVNAIGDIERSPARGVPQIGAGSMIQKITNQIRVFRLERRSEVDSSPKVAKGLPIKRSTCLYYRLPVTVPKNADCFHKSGYRLYEQVSHTSSANTAILTR